MAVSASLQQLSGGVASSVAGLIVFQTASGRIEHYDILGYVVMGAIASTIAMMYPINRAVARRQALAPAAAPGAPVAAPEPQPARVAAE